MPSPLTLVFCGTPEFAVPTLQKLVDSGHLVRLVVTQPDRPRGRGMELTASPVKQCAQGLNIRVAQPDKIKQNQEFRAQLEAIKPDAIIVVGYGRIIPPWMLDLPHYGNINLHASLLPKYRGAAPIQWAIAKGETTTGVTTMKIDAGLDTGDILVQQKLPIDPSDTSVTLAPKLAEIGAELMVETLRGLQAGTIQPQPQNDPEATLAPILKKEDGKIEFHRSAREIENRLRGFQPWPGAFTTFRGKNLQLTKASAATRPATPGELLIEDGKLFAGCGSGALQLLELQPEGKKRISAKDFIHGYHPRTGEKLGTGN
jgi:methionyl-tRNA formyltransferase